MDDLGRAIGAQKDGGGPSVTVVVARHGRVVGSGGLNLDEVAGLDIIAEFYVGEEDIGLAMPTGDGEGFEGGVFSGFGGNGGHAVVRAVEAGAGVVGETAIDDDKCFRAGFDLDGFEGSDSVDGDASVGSDGPTGFLHKGGVGIDFIQPGADGGDDGLVKVSERKGLLFGDVRDAEAAADIEKLGGEAVMVLEALGDVGENGSAGELGFVIHQLRPHVAVESMKFHAVFFYKRGGSIDDFGFDKESELGVVLPGSDFFVGDGIDAGGESENDFDLCLEIGEGFEFKKVVNDDVVDVVVEGEADFGFRLVVAVHVAAVAGDASGEGGSEFSFARDIDQATLLGGDFEDGEGGVGFASVSEGEVLLDLGKCTRVSADSLSKDLLGEDVQGSTEFNCQLSCGIVGQNQFGF